MNNKDLLNEYRLTLVTLRYLEQQLNACGTNGSPRGVASPSADSRPATNDPDAAARQIWDGLHQQQQHLRARLQAMTGAVTEIISRAGLKTLLVLNYYYLMGRTDQEIARTMGVSREHVCRLRNAFLQGL